MVFGLKIFDVVALGELLVDFTEVGISPQENPVFEANPGGAPCNVLSMLQHLGKKTAFIGKVGDDSFGRMLRDAVAGQGIDTGNIIVDSTVPTTLAFVHTAPDGDRSFSFYRNPGADMMLRKEEVNFSLVNNTRIFHFGSLSMTETGAEEATKEAVKIAKDSGALVSFDPNLRPPLWDSLNKAKEKISYGISQCDILKISDDEIAFFTGTEDIDKGIAKIQEEYNVPLVCATMGRRGSRAYCNGIRVECAPFLNKDTIETTGAGDTFMACVLNWILDYGIDGMDAHRMHDMLGFANAASSIITTRKGALMVMPEESEVWGLINERRKSDKEILY
ncbi:MAG: carbohydrate kinase [Lachnospiraceae bacterium]|nr:carbohydrate kinase [Lachnospiraceae bacterium]